MAHELKSGLNHLVHPHLKRLVPMIAIKSVSLAKIEKKVQILLTTYLKEEARLRLQYLMLLLTKKHKTS